MSKIIILPNNQFPLGKIIKINNNILNRSLCEILLINNVNIQNSCGMFGKCTTCKVSIKEGLNFLNKIDYEEFEILNNKFMNKNNYRLSCQLYININYNIIINLF